MSMNGKSAPTRSATTGMSSAMRVIESCQRALLALPRRRPRDELHPWPAGGLAAPRRGAATDELAVTGDVVDPRLGAELFLEAVAGVLGEEAREDHDVAAVR